MITTGHSAVAADMPGRGLLVPATARPPARPSRLEEIPRPAPAARTAAASYLIQTGETAESWRFGLLARAIARLDMDAAAVRAIDAVASDGLVHVEIEVAGRSRRAARRAERAFDQVWYDAFGERDAPHAGRFVERATAG